MINNDKNKVVDQFVSFHTHSTYSFTDGYGTPKQYLDRCAEINQGAIGVSDHGNISSHYKWYKEAETRNIKPILGVEFYIVKSTKEIEDKQREYNHVTVFAKNNIGYRNLLKLVTKSWLENFYYKPRITLEELEEYKDGLIVFSGCLSGMICQMIKDKQSDKDIIKELRKWNNIFDDFYIEVSPLSFPEGKAVMAELYRFAKLTKILMVATTDCHYVCKEHSHVHEVLLCVQTVTTWDNPKRWKFDQDDFYLKTRKEMEESFEKIFPDLDFTEALDNTVKIADTVHFKFPQSTPLKYPIPDKKKLALFKKLCEEGLKFRKLDNKKYRERMEYEIDIINQKNYIDYFLIVIDLVQWSKNNNILVGPARGSAAGSLVCYLTRITEVDPLLYGLIFERFIDLNRMDLPDIDIDFEDSQRHFVKEYLAKKYGENKVGDIATFSVFRGKSSVDSIARVFKIPHDETAKLKSMIIERSGGDSRASFTMTDTFESDLFDYPKKMMKKYPEMKYVVALEGQIKNLSKHASGVILSNEDVTEYCAIYQYQGNKVLSIDYADAGAIGLIKVDILGLNTLTGLHAIKNLIKKNYNRDIDYYNLPLNDKEVFKGFCNNKLSGIFQFDGQAVNQVCRQIKPQTFEELGDINALARPGPLNSGSTTLYITRKDGKAETEYPHALMKEMTKDTYGIVVYQEQVMKTMREVGLMSWKDTSDIRKNISRSLGIEAFNRFKSIFEVGAKKNGLSQKEIDSIWASICTFGSWAFNKSHSVSYAMISYWTMYMKVHYPAEFYTVMMANARTEGKIRKMLKDARREGFKILPVDVNKSQATFSIDTDEKAIRIGFSQIKGIGHKVGQSVVDKRPKNGYKDFEDFLAINKTRETSKLVKLLKMVGAFSNFDMITEWGETYKIKAVKNTQLAMICPYAVEVKITEKWNKFIEKYIDLPITPISELSHEESEGKEEIYLTGVIYDKNVKNKLEEMASKGKKWIQKTYKNGDIEQPNFMNFQLEDDSDFITIRLSTWHFPLFQKLILEDIKGDDVIMVRGKMGSGIRLFFANSIICLNHLKVKLENGEKLSNEERKFVL